MKTYFTSDQHFEHANLIEKMGRVGFSSMSEHDEAVLDAINAKVPREAWLVLLGDFCWTNPRKWRQRIRCKHVRFVLGNHDKPAQCQAAFGEWRHILEHKTEALGKVVCCHYPIAFWPRSHHGAYHLYGHCHDSRETTLDAWAPERRSMDVGVDSALRLLGSPAPFSEDEIFELLAARDGHDPVTFYRGES